MEKKCVVFTLEYGERWWRSPSGLLYVIFHCEPSMYRMYRTLSPGIKAGAENEEHMKDCDLLRDLRNWIYDNQENL